MLMLSCFESCAIFLRSVLAAVEEVVLRDLHEGSKITPLKKNSSMYLRKGLTPQKYKKLHYGFKLFKSLQTIIAVMQ